MSELERRLAGNAGAAAALAVAVFTSANAQTIERVYPLDPPNGATVGIKPYLKVGFDGTELPKVRFRIELSRDDFDSIEHTFDQRADGSGWAYTSLGGESGALYMARKPVEDGKYQWRVAAWNGVYWVPGKDDGWFRMDGIPPGDVTGIDMRIDYDAKSVNLSWKPVTVDRDGRPETIARHHVNRYTKKSMFFVIRPFGLATVESTSFQDEDRLALESPILFYRWPFPSASSSSPRRPGRRPAISGPLRPDRTS